MPLKRYLTYKQVSEKIGIAQGTLRNWVSLQKIPFVKINGAVRFDEERLAAWLKTKEVNPRRPKLP